MLLNVRTVLFMVIFLPPRNCPFDRLRKKSLSFILLTFVSYWISEIAVK